MISLAGLQHLNRETAIQAAEMGKHPIPLTYDDWLYAMEMVEIGSASKALRSIPDLGEVPDGWEVVDSCFHDITGFDLFDAGGPAASIFELCRWGLRVTDGQDGLYFMLGSAYQFQATTYALRRDGS